MPERKFYARCTEEGCEEVFEGQLTWYGAPPTNVYFYDLEGKSPIIDLLQQHHLQAKEMAHHNYFALYLAKEEAMHPPLQDPYRPWSKIPNVIGFIGVTRQRNLSGNFVLGSEKRLATE